MPRRHEVLPDRVVAAYAVAVPLFFLRRLLFFLGLALQIWDTAGQERFHGGSLGSGFFRGANAALLVYDVACAVSFEQVGVYVMSCHVRPVMGQIRSCHVMPCPDRKISLSACCGTKLKPLSKLWAQQ